MQKKDDSSSCWWIFAVAILAAFIYAVSRVIAFFQKPNAWQTIGQTLLDLLMAAGICLGFILVLIVGGFLFSLIPPRKHQIRMKKMSREYPARCTLVEMENPPGGTIYAHLPFLPGQETILPVYALCSLTNLGPCLSPLPASYAWAVDPEEGAKRFTQVSRGYSGPVILPFDCFEMYYVLIQQEGNLRTETTPTGAAGFSGVLPASAEKSLIKVVLIFSAVKPVSDLKQIIQRERPLKVSLLLLNENGQEDPASARQFYMDLLSLVHANSSIDDDSWMYRSRPTMPW